MPGWTIPLQYRLKKCIGGIYIDRYLTDMYANVGNLFKNLFKKCSKKKMWWCLKKQAVFLLKGVENLLCCDLFHKNIF